MFSYKKSTSVVDGHTNVFQHAEKKKKGRVKQNGYFDFKRRKVQKLHSNYDIRTTRKRAFKEEKKLYDKGLNDES
jgi:hypothetical protein